MLADMILAELAIARIERMVAGRRPIEVVRVRITDAGGRALGVPYASGSDRVSDL
jgi:hypothetical protein